MIPPSRPPARSPQGGKTALAPGEAHDSAQAKTEPHGVHVPVSPSASGPPSTSPWPREGPLGPGRARTAPWAEGPARRPPEPGASGRSRREGPLPDPSGTLSELRPKETRERPGSVGTACPGPFQGVAPPRRRGGCGAPPGRIPREPRGPPLDPPGGERPSMVEGKGSPVPSNPPPPVIPGPRPRGPLRESPGPVPKKRPGPGFPGGGTGSGGTGERRRAGGREAYRGTAA